MQFKDCTCTKNIKSFIVVNQFVDFCSLLYFVCYRVLQKFVIVWGPKIFIINSSYNIQRFSSCIERVKLMTDLAAFVQFGLSYGKYALYHYSLVLYKVLQVCKPFRLCRIMLLGLSSISSHTHQQQMWIQQISLLSFSE